ncbi:30S ribosomal protein S12 methylthiotransferase RimO [Candidatus Aerophobetes bacterium]|nr:30S ribosomal protein S12 methylthiotransferase RimO [Candidatus Aerophobetes bacterium]
MQDKRKIKEKIKINLISLGCPKNLVDSEVILGRLGERGYILTSFFREADVVIINTCSFIKDARDESYRIISKILRQKSPRQKLIVCGCLPQLEKRKLFSKFSGIDALLGSADFYNIDKVVDDVLFKGERVFSISKPEFIYNSSFSRLISTPPGYTYLKIAEGCSNRCSYCLIPTLRGNFRSRDIDDVVKEAKELARMHIKELILTSQDTTFYGHDRDEKSYLTVLLKKLEKIKGIEWIRLLYLHPAHFDFKLIPLIKNSAKILSYIDLPFQHTQDEILKLMGRPPFNTALKIIEKIREVIPDATLRTTLMVGFPGEKEQHFEKLLKDVENLQFDWLGVFTYSREKKTPAYAFPDQVSPKVKEKRRKEVFRLQEKITYEKNKNRVGNIYPLMIDFTSNLNEAEGHTIFQTPEIDGKTYLDKNYPAGVIIQAKVTEVKNIFDVLADEV